MREDYVVSKAARGLDEISKISLGAFRPGLQAARQTGPSMVNAAIGRRATFDAAPRAARPPSFAANSANPASYSSAAREASEAAAKKKAADAAAAYSALPRSRTGKVKMPVANPTTYAAPANKAPSELGRFMENPITRGSMYVAEHPTAFKYGAGAAAGTAAVGGGLYATSRRREG